MACGSRSELDELNFHAKKPGNKIRYALHFISLASLRDTKTKKYVRNKNIV